MWRAYLAGLTLLLSSPTLSRARSLDDAHNETLPRDDKGVERSPLTPGDPDSRYGTASDQEGATSAGPTHPRQRQVYFFAAPGAFIPASAATLGFGGGAEWFLTEGSGLALGFEGSVLTFAECFSCGGYFLGSINGSYHFNSRKLVPFVTGGLSRAGSTEGGGINLLNFGGGVTYWLGHLGLRVEVREHVDWSWEVPNVSLRIGVAF